MKKYLKINILFIVISSVFLIMPSSVVADDNIHARIINGDTVPARDIAVAKITWKSGRYARSLCSGVLITPRYVLMSAHCATSTPDKYTVRIARRKFLVRAIRVHPRAQKATRRFKNDVAILTLRNRTKSKISPLPLLVRNRVQVADTLAIYGYGIDEELRSGVLKSGIAKVTNVNRFFIETTFSEDGLSASCAGDSGGPALLTYINSRGRVVTGVVGITSWGTTKDCVLGTKTYYVNLQRKKSLNFIKKVAPHVRTL